jgi:hypothetical protein
MNRNLKSSGSIAKIRIYKIKEGMKKKEKWWKSGDMQEAELNQKLQGRKNTWM